MRGKHANLSQRRREVEATETELVALRRKNAQLVEETRTLRSELATARKSHQDEARILRTQRDEGHAPLIVAVEKRLRDEIAAHQHTRAELKKTKNTHSRWAGRVIEHFVAEHAMTGLEATEAALNSLQLSDTPEHLTLTDAGGYISKGTSGEGVDRVRSIQRARGQRRSS